MKSPKFIDSTTAFEAALCAPATAGGRYLLRLFITGTTPRCLRAIQNLHALCEANLPGQYDLEVIDIYQHPEQAKPEQIVVTPTLIKEFPLPLRRMIGDLSDTERVLTGLGIPQQQLARARNA
jgi:circadian clock protein KaiB